MSDTPQTTEAVPTATPADPALPVAPPTDTKTATPVVTEPPKDVPPPPAPCSKCGWDKESIDLYETPKNRGKSSRCCLPCYFSAFNTAPPDINSHFSGRTKRPDPVFW